MEKSQHIDVHGMVNGKKTYYSISEVCDQIGLEPHVLRYWESEFSQLRPKKNRAGNRAYRDKDIEIVKCIKYLLYEEQFTIPGAKKKLSGNGLPEEEENRTKCAPTPAPEVPRSNGTLSEIKEDLEELLKLLKT